jgi:co-chaperonin GroES (HSP10)
MKEEAKLRIADSIEDSPVKRRLASSDIDTINPADLPRQKQKSYEEIAYSKRIDIPPCMKIPVNGRLYVIETAGSESKTDAGIIIPHKYRSKKGEDTEIRDVSRYFVVRWDRDGIPEEIQNKLHVGIEISIFLPQEAEDFKLPVMVDFETGSQFLIVHYNELAGISETVPQIVEK